MNKKTVLVLFGGISSEHEVSRNSAFMVISHMNPDKYFILPLGITKTGKWLLYNGPVEHIKTGQWEKFATPAILSPDATQKCLLKIIGDHVKEIPIDVVFPVLHGLWGEDGTIQGLFEIAGLPYVGSGVLASSVSMDKVYTKMIAKSQGIHQANYLWYKKSQLKEMDAILDQVEQKLGFPCFVKPSNAGSSMGITKVKSKDQLEEALLFAADHDRKIIVEEFVDGREIECSVLGNDHPKASGVGEIVAGAEFYDYDAKYNNPQSKTVIPADLPQKTIEEIQRIALKIYDAVDACGLARVDFFVNRKTKRVVFNELNTMPGFTTISMYPMLWEQEGMKKEALIDALIDLAFERAGLSDEEE